MLLQVENLLSPEIVAQMNHSMDQATWVDGRDIRCQAGRLGLHLQGAARLEQGA